MAIIKCPECGKNVSENAKSCPNCGSPINTKKSFFLKPWVWVVIILTGILVWAMSDYNSNKMTKEKAREHLDKAFEKHMDDWEKGK